MSQRYIRPNSKRKEERNKNDSYITPYSMIQQLLDVEVLDKNGSILEPCCSIHRSIPTTLIKNGFTNITENIYEETNNSFLDFDETIQYDYIISNTPYGNKNFINFVNKAKKIAKKKVILLYPLNCLNGVERYNKVYNDEEYKLARLYQFIRYPMLEDTIREDGKYKTGMSIYAWYVWEKGYTGETVLKQIDNNEYCVY
jgi:hypothetical protein